MFTIEKKLAHAKSNDVLRVRDNRINSATTLVIMSSLYMRQIAKSMVNWNIYNDNIMTSDVSYLKNSRSSQVKTVIHTTGGVRALYEVSERASVRFSLLFFSSLGTTSSSDAAVHFEHSTVSITFILFSLTCEWGRRRHLPN